ncbi:MAG: hypothetical protein Fur0032_22390 [Terrimicrobiaceae bacterium]
MNISPNSLLAAVGVILTTTTSIFSQVVFSENFTGNMSSLIDDGGPKYAFTLASDQLTIGNSSPGFEVGRSYTTQTWSNDDFTISAKVHPTQMAFTSGMLSVFAYGKSAFPDNGYAAELVQVGFSVDQYRLDIRAGSLTIASSSIFNILADPFGTPDYTRFTLELAGAFLVGGDLALTATFIPDPLDNPTSLSTISVNSTVLAASVDLTGTAWGIRQLTGGNTVLADYDNLVITVVPEPSTWVLLVGVLAVLTVSRSRQKLRRAMQAEV